MDADVTSIAAACVCGLEENTRRNTSKSGDVVGFNIVKTTGGLTAECDGGSATANDRIPHHNILRWPINPEPVRVSTRLQHQGIVVYVNVGVLNQNLA